ncbi:hypothetical protein FXO37_05510 [Capsicum annuum]|nr:hypothetical protein FXO37_05510 [Capsicum annuum]
MSPSPLSFVALDNESCRCYRLDPFISMQKESGDRQRAFWAFKFGNARHGQAPVRVVTNLVSEHGSWSQGVCKIASALDIKFKTIDGHGGGCDDFLVNDTSYMKVIYRLEQCMQVLRHNLGVQILSRVYRQGCLKVQLASLLCFGRPSHLDRQRAFQAFGFGNACHGQGPDHNESNNQLRATLHDVFGLENSDSLHGNEDSYGGYADGPDRYLDTDDEDVQNLVDDEMNGSHQSVQDKDLSVSDGEEDHYGEDDVEEKEDPKHDDSYTEEQYTAGPVEGMSFSCLQAVFAFYKEHSRLNGFGVVKKSANKLAGQLKELSRTVKRSLVADDIACLRPSKSIRLLEVEVGGPERMRCTPKDCRNYTLQQQRLQILSSDAAWLMPFAFFIGVNHHNQSILLVCSLLMSEDIETYAFIFRTWLTAMGKIPLMAILTDLMDLKNVLKTHFKTYMVWEDDMVVPNIPDSDFDTDATIVRNSREVRSRGKPQINRNRSSRQYAFHGDARRWGYGYYDVYDKGKNNQGRSGGGRRGCRGSRRGGVCSSRGGRGDDANINNHPIVHEFF